MNLEKAIQTAIEYEIKARDIFANASESIADPVGRRIFQMLAKDERRHIDYLNKTLQGWLRTGEVTFGELMSVVPAKGVITKGSRDLQSRILDHHRSSGTLSILKKALDAEVVTVAPLLVFL